MARDLKQVWQLVRTLAGGGRGKNYVGSYVEILTFLGCWTGGGVPPPSRGHVRYWLPRLTLLVMAFLTVVVSPLSVVMLWQSDLLTILEPSINFFSTSFLASAIATMLYRGRLCSEMVASFEEMKAFNRDPERFARVSQGLDTFSRAVFCYFSWLVGNVVWGAFAASVKSLATRRYFFGYWFPEASYASPFFELAVCTWYVVMLYAATVMALTYGLLMTLLYEAVVQLQLLSETMGSLFAQAQEGEDLSPASTPTPAVAAGVDGRDGQPCHVVGETKEVDLSARSLKTHEAEKTLKACVQHHQAIISFVWKVRDAFELFLVSQYSHALFPMVLAIILVSRASTILDIKIMLYLGTVVCLTVYQALFCWLSSRIEEESASVREAAYGCEWQDGPESVKRSLRIVMSFSNQPLVLKVAGFIPLSMPNFYSGMEMIYSQYMSLTATMHREQPY